MEGRKDARHVWIVVAGVAVVVSAVAAVAYYLHSQAQREKKEARTNQAEEIDDDWVLLEKNGQEDEEPFARWSTKHQHDTEEKNSEVKIVPIVDNHREGTDKKEKEEKEKEKETEEYDTVVIDHAQTEPRRSKKIRDIPLGHEEVQRVIDSLGNLHTGNEEESVSSLVTTLREYNDCEDIALRALTLANWYSAKSRTSGTFPPFPNKTEL